MVFTAIQNTLFFTDAVKMGLSVRTRQALVNEGISMADDLHEWEDDEWDQFASNYKQQTQIVDPNNANLLINQSPFLVPVKYLKRLKEASRIAHFYKAVGRPLSQQNMRWQHVIENYAIQRKEMENMLKEDVPDVTKLTKGTTVAAWAACMRVFLSKVSSVRDQATLIYMARLDENVGALKAMKANKPHSINHG